MILGHTYDEYLVFLTKSGMTSSQHILKYLINLLCLPVSLGMIGRAKVHRLMQSFPKLRCELGTSIGHNFFGYTVKTNDFGYVQLCQLRSGVLCLDSHKMGKFG
jgi:hypothetical protein